MQYIKVVVCKLVDKGQFKDLFHTSVPFNENISFPFDKVIPALRVLFPHDNVCIHFTLM